MTKVERQKELEKEMVRLGRDRYNKKLLEVQQGKASLSDLTPGQQLIKQHLEAVTDAVHGLVENPPYGGWTNHNHHLLDYLKGCTGKKFRPDEIAYIVIRVCSDAMMFTQQINEVALRLADLLEDNNNFRKFEEGKQSARLFKNVQKQIKTCTNYRRKRILMKRSMEYANVSQDKWSHRDKLVLGNVLIRLFEKVTGLIEVNRMVVQEQTRHPKSITKIIPTQKAEAWLDSKNKVHEELTPFFLPMVAKPKDWTTPTNGGYYLNLRRDVTLIKTSNENYMADLRNVDMSTVYSAVNALQDTKWQINHKVKEVMEYLWKKGRGVEWGLPNPDGDELPPCPVCDQPFEPGKHGCFEEDSEQHKEWKRKAAKVYDRNHRTVGKVKAIDYKLFVADKFKDENELYFVHTLDWRGRAYPVGSFLHPQGDDTAKGLLQFAEGKPIDTPEALVEWKRHGANCYGHDKLPIAERVQWVDDNKQAILDCAADPLTNKLWIEADKPYQFLAFCFDFYGYHNEEDHVSQLPVSMDGACNGLQNFSAMLRDEVGGAATNIVSNGDRQDIYQRVADVVAAEVAEDAWSGRGYDDPVWSGCQVTKEQAAQAWDGKVDRQIVKRGVMTMPYGSKQYGMREQIIAELEKQIIEGKGDKLEGIEDVMPYAHYLSCLLYDGIRAVVIAAGEAMDYLQDVARVVAGHNLPLKWVTPSGFVVVQDYKKYHRKRVRIVFGGVEWRPTLYTQKDKIDPRKQSQGISPNFVHSLDAAHMMLTVLGCMEEGVESFGMIHDSFATHAADAPTMQRVLREAFVKMYEDDRLEDFRNQIMAQLPEELAAKVIEVKMPDTYNLNLNDVLNSPYFFA